MHPPALLSSTHTSMYKRTHTQNTKTKLYSLATCNLPCATRTNTRAHMHLCTEMRRYLTFISRHPVLREDEGVQYFLSADDGGDFKDNCKARFKHVVEEFKTNPVRGVADGRICAVLVVQFAVNPFLCFYNICSPLTVPFAATSFRRPLLSPSPATFLNMRNPRRHPTQRGSQRMPVRHRLSLSARHSCRRRMAPSWPTSRAPLSRSWLVSRL